MAGLFSNKYDVEQGINDAMTKTALSYGAIDRSAYAPMTASTALQGDMAGRGIGMMLGGQDPMAAKQSAVDEIMTKYPDPDTPEELEAVAADLQARGLTDYAFQVREVITEMKAVATSTAASKLAANTPPDSAFNRLTTSLSNKVLTKDMVQGYLQQKWNDSTGSVYGEVGKPFQPLSTNDVNYDAWKKQYDYDYKEAYEELKGEVENYSIEYQASSPNKLELNSLLQNPETQIQDFEDYVGTDGGNDAGNYLRDQVFVLSDAKKSRLTKVNPDDSASISQAPVIDAMGGAIPSATYDWAKELEEQYRTA